MSKQEQVSKRGLASASEDTRERVAKAGGEAPHKKRGLQAASYETRKSVARKGGLARGEQRRRNSFQKTASLSVDEEEQSDEENLDLAAVTESQ